MKEGCKAVRCTFLAAYSAALQKHLSVLQAAARLSHMDSLSCAPGF